MLFFFIHCAFIPCKAISLQVLYFLTNLLEPLNLNYTARIWLRDFPTLTIGRIQSLGFYESQSKLPLVYYLGAVCSLNPKIETGQS